MKNATNMPFYKVAIWSFAAVTMLAGCSKKDKKDDAPAPVAVEIEEVDVSSANGEGTFTYTSNIANAKFKCKIEYNGQAAEWQSCPKKGKTFPTPEGVPYKFSVKAIAPNGDETEVTSLEGGKTNGQQQQELVAQILGKEAIVGSIYDQPTLSVKFAVKGADINPAELRYECKRENEVDFRRCPNGDTYDFGQLINGSEYGLAVRAVHDASKSVSVEDTIKFTVKLANLVTSGEDKLRSQKTGTVDLGFGSLPTDVTLKCKLNGSQEISCTPIDLDSLSAGSHRLDISAVDSQGVQYSSSSINFCAKQCQVEPMPQYLPVGSFYYFQVPDEMHVTQYSTNKTSGTNLLFYRVMAESDPTYIGNDNCLGPFQRIVSAAAPDGSAYDYCQSTPQTDIHKWLNEYRMANNHIEVATNIDQVSPNNQERIMINVFDGNYEYMRGRSRFEELCLNRRGTIQKTPIAIPFVQDFWNDPVRANRAEFWMCDVQIAGLSGQGLPQIEQWRVGAFFISQDGADLPLPDMSCFDFATCPCNNPNLLEVVYMVRPNGSNWTPEFFARSAQQRFLRHLQEMVPN
jgi:hypothetical protein